MLSKIPGFNFSTSTDLPVSCSRKRRRSITCSDEMIRCSMIGVSSVKDSGRILPLVFTIQSCSALRISISVFMVSVPPLTIPRRSYHRLLFQNVVLQEIADAPFRDFLPVRPRLGAVHRRLLKPVRLFQPGILIDVGVVVLFPGGRKVARQVAPDPLNNLCRPDGGAAVEKLLHQVPAEDEVAHFVAMVREVDLPGDRRQARVLG